MIKNYTLEDMEYQEKTKSLISTVENKKLYGEVNTPLHFVKEILELIPEYKFKNPCLKWLDPGCGTGNFSIILYFKLLVHLEEAIPEIESRKDYIIKNMIYMIELQPENIKFLKYLFGETANIYEGDFLKYNTPNNICELNGKSMPLKFDAIIGNPPFNSNGLKKVPTNKHNNKSEDGTTIWVSFIIKSIALLEDGSGILCVFIPSLWMKPDKEHLYEYLIQYDIQYLNCISNTQTNKIFKGNAQTPSCFFLLTKQSSSNVMTIYDRNHNKYISYYIKNGAPIPVFGQEIIKKLQKFCYIWDKDDEVYNNAIVVLKTNMPPKNTVLSATKTTEFKYSNITTCKLISNTNSPELIINYSNKPLIFADVPKLILAHKMYGFPYLDLLGEYGISNRDNYIIIKKNLEDLVKLQQFLSTKTALYLFEATRYRMKYLERYAFQLIPDITRLADFPKVINDDTIAEYFGFDEKDKQNIQELHKKSYKFFV